MRSLLLLLTSCSLGALAPLGATRAQSTAQSTAQATTQASAELRNTHIRARFGARGLTAVASLSPAREFRLERDDARVVLHAGIDTLRFDTAVLPPPRMSRGQRQTAHTVTYTWQVESGRLEVTYELRPDWHFIGKSLRVTPGTASYHVDSVTVFRTVFAERPTSVVRPASARPATLGTRDYGAAVRFGTATSLLVVVQNPFLDVPLTGDTLQLRYAPDMPWESSYGPFDADRGLLSPVTLSGHTLPARMAPEWVPASSAPNDPGLDAAEVSAFTAMVRSAMLYTPPKPITVFVGWTANDYQIDVAVPEGRDEYRRLFDQAAAMGAEYVLYGPSNSALARREASVDDWSWEHVLWLGLGQRIRQGTWNPRRDSLPTTVSEMLQAAKARKLGVLAYVYPVLPFAQDSSWLVAARANSTKQVAILSNRKLQDWLVDEMIVFRARTGIAGYAFDHTFLNYAGSSRYAQWHGWRRVMETLRRRAPDIVIDGRQAYHLYGPWSWLAGNYPHPTFHDEQPESFRPYPDLHFDRVSANRERYTAYHYRNYEFTPAELMPGYMTHQTSRSDESNDMPYTRTNDRGVVLDRFRARDWDVLGWRYSVLSSIAVAAWNNVLDYIPARDSAEYAHFAAADREWLRAWLDFTVQHKEILRHTRTILGQPALGKIDGTAAIVNDRGFVFLFNPDAQALTARVPLDASIGLTARVPLDASIGLSRTSRLLLRELHPLPGRTHVLTRGDTLSVMLDGASALVLEVAPAPAVAAQPLLIGTTGSAAVNDGVLALRNVRGESGTRFSTRVILPRGTPVTSVRVNNVAFAPGERRGDTLLVTGRFGGSEVRPMLPVITADAAAAAGTTRVRGTLTLPRELFAQLTARRRAWPLPWTSEDYRTTWLASERLLLFAPIATPDDRYDMRLFIDGRLVEFKKAYTAVRTVRSTFVGWYADISLLEPDKPHHVEIELPADVPAGWFRGVFVENVEREYTMIVTPG